MEALPPAQPLSDGVVTLRLWEHEDEDALVDAIDGDPQITSFLELIPQPYRAAEASAWIDAAAAMWLEGTGAPFAVVADDTVVGGAGITWIDREHAVGDVGYWTRLEARRRGYTTRAVRLLAAWAFSVGAERLQIRADTENDASLRVAERSGFRREGIMRSIRYNPRLGRRMNFALYSLLPGEL